MITQQGVSSETAARSTALKPFPCPEPGCTGKMIFGSLSKQWKDRQRAKGRTPPNFAYFCTERKHGCVGLLLAQDDGCLSGAALSKETRDLRKKCHDAFDRIWRSAGTVDAYRKTFSNKRTPSEAQHRRSIMGKLRRVAYFFMAHAMGVKESEAHISRIVDPATLRAFLDVASRTTASEVSDWWEREGEALYFAEYRAACREARSVRQAKHNTNPP